MSDAIDRTLEIVRTQPNSQLAWVEIISVCRENEPSGLWDLLPSPDIERDILAADAWLEAQLSALPESKGLYLGLDTLNMYNSEKMNVEFGGTPDCDVTDDAIDWVYEDLDYGERHLILGLAELKRVYGQPQWQSVFSLADYLLFLGYSGVVLGQAFIRLPTTRTLLPAWGFHDGDLFALGRKTPDRFEFICK